MSNRHVMNQLERTLLALLPDYTPSSLPRQLVELATTLLLQSQSRAAQLKPEEEPARYNAICEIACHRLKTRLNLPKHESQPPCPPRTYKKLYQFLDRTLTIPTERYGDNEPKKSFTSKTVTPTKVRQSSAMTPSISKKRALCDLQLLTPASTPSGTPHKRIRFTDEVEGDVITVAPIPFLTKVMRPKARGQDLELPPAIMADTESGMVMEDLPGDDDEDEEAAIEDIPIKQTGLGSLMENRFDWLSKNRTDDYTHWKATILRSIRAAECKQRAIEVVG